jgi:putative Mg2+ transporter-C (MgtC) family protein
MVGLPHLSVLPFHDVVLRLVVGSLLGVGIGFERQWRQAAAGVQTTGLVATGAALFCVAAPAMGESSGDPMRVVAAVVQGVGFLAGGVILKEGMNVRGLNTAATVWSTAAVGALAGVGLLIEALIGAIAIISLNLIFLPLVDAIDRRFTDKHPPHERKEAQ